MTHVVQATPSGIYRRSRCRALISLFDTNAAKLLSYRHNRIVHTCTSRFIPPPGACHLHRIFPELPYDAFHNLGIRTIRCSTNISFAPPPSVARFAYVLSMLLLFCYDVTPLVFVAVVASSDIAYHDLYQGDWVFNHSTHSFPHL